MTVQHGVRPLIPLYAIRALEPLEALAVEGHVAECSLCALELSAFEDVARALGPLPQPPPELFDRILTRVRVRGPASTVVLVDDVSEIRLLLRVQLESVGGFVVVGEGEDGFQAVLLAHVHQPDFVVLDLSLPRLSGVDAIPMIMRCSPTTQIVACSAFDDLASEASRRGASACLTKAIGDIADVGRTLRSLVVTEPA
jgi:CheY-like chemotaxis protein